MFDLISNPAINEALNIMIFGMSGIFIVLFILYLFSVILLKIFPDKEGK